MTKKDTIKLLDFCIEIQKETGVRIVFNYTGLSDMVDVHCYRNNVIDVENHIELFHGYCAPSPMSYKIDIKKIETEIRELITN